MVASVEVLDPKGAIKCPHFSGRREDFEAWAFPFESYVGLLGWSFYVERTIIAKTTTDNDTLEEEPLKVSRTLYHLLATTTRGPAQSLIKLTKGGHGLEALRRLYADHRTNLDEDHAMALGGILTPNWWSDRSDQIFTGILTQWGELVADYQRATGEAISDRVKISVIVTHAPKYVKNFLTGLLPRETTEYVSLRHAAWQSVLGQRSQSRSRARGLRLRLCDPH